MQPAAGQLPRKPLPDDAIRKIPPGTFFLKGILHGSIFEGTNRATWD